LVARLAADGIFGSKTRQRVIEFQRDGFITPDGIVGPQTWGTILDAIAKLFPRGGPVGGGPTSPVPIPPNPTDPHQALRDAIIQIAEAEALQGGVAAKSAGGIDPTNKRTLRLGHDKLLKYFRVAAPNSKQPGTTYFGEDAIKYLSQPGQLSPCPHWCGIFALWAYKTAGAGVGDWKMSVGISAVAGFRQVDKKAARPGDVGYVASPHQHHFIIKSVALNGSLVTIEGNSDPNSNHNIKTSRTLNTIDAIYSAL
jgi:hypothetical protein